MRLPWISALAITIGLVLGNCSNSHGPASNVAEGTCPHASPTTADVPFSWERSTPEAQGIDSRELIRALSRVRDDDLRLHSLIVVRNGCVVVEAYVHPYDKETLHNAKSASKSMLSAVVGIALEEGILTSLDQTVSDFFPEYFTEDMDPQKRSITLRHLLTMTSGLELDEPGPIEREIFASDDWIKTTFAQPMVEDPGRRFLYSSGLPHTMSGILTRTSGQSLLELSDRTLFGPLDIAEVQWMKTPMGYYLGGGELSMRPRDMVKFGLLFLNGGRWNGKQVVPTAWVRESTRDHMVGVKADRGYGYWWWRIPGPWSWLIGDYGYTAAGWGGQRIAVFPHRNMVVVVTFADPDGFDKLFGDFKIWSIGDTALPPNPQAVAALEALVRELEHPAPKAIPALPALADEISGRTYVLDDVDLPSPFRHIAFDFTRPDRSTMTIDTEEDTYRLAVGLDGLYRMTPTGRFGTMPSDNRSAVRGRWTGANTFAMDYLEVGAPNHVHLDVSFTDDRISISVQVEPKGLHLIWKGMWTP
jgi:CubicO group peptidase (beta-lactamase class C family)